MYLSINCGTLTSVAEGVPSVLGKIISTSNGGFTQAAEDAFGVGTTIEGVGLYDGFFDLVGGDRVTGADARFDLVGDLCGEVAVLFNFWRGDFVCLEGRLNRPRLALLLRFFWL